MIVCGYRKKARAKNYNIVMKKIFGLFLSLLIPIHAAAQIAKGPLWCGVPYLQNVSADGVTVIFQTPGRQVHSWVEIGKDSVHTQTFRQLADGQEVVHDANHRVRVEGLQPGATYYYRVCATEILENRAYSKKFGITQRTPFYGFKLPSDTTESFTALVLNDLHGVGSVIDAMASVADTIPHDFVVFNGDCLSEPQDFGHAIAQLHRLTRAFHASSVPAVFLRGNHEIRNAWSSGMLSLFDWPGAHTYHSFSWGDTRFVMLDCGEDKPDSTWVYYGLNDFSAFRKEQADFLKKELSGKAYRKARRHLLIHHIPLWFDLEGDSGATSAPCRDLWLPLLKKSGFDLSINGHVHEYRYIPNMEAGNPYPVLTGGGPSLDSATMTVVRKRGKRLHISVMNAEGKVIEEINL